MKLHTSALILVASLFAAGVEANPTGPIPHTEMPQPLQSIIDAHERKGIILMFLKPGAWCRWEFGPDIRVWWPHDTDCTLDQETMVMGIAASHAKNNAIGQGADPAWIHPDTDVVLPVFTVDGLVTTGGGFSSAANAGHIFIASQRRYSLWPHGYCTVVHEWAHANYQYEVFPSMTADLWGQGVWPEALATLHMMQLDSCKNDWDEIYSPWNSQWVTGYFGGTGKQKRQLALFYDWLGKLLGVNWWEFQLNQHALLIDGKEVEALNAIVPAPYGDLERLFAEWVVYYNERNTTQQPNLVQLGPPDNFPQLPNRDEIPVFANGVTEGLTWKWYHHVSEPLYDIFQATPRCPEPSSACYAVSDPAGAIVAIDCNDGTTRHSGTSQIYAAGWHTVTCSSLAGNCHMREWVLAQRLGVPHLPAPNTNDPWAEIVGCP